MKAINVLGHVSMAKLVRLGVVMVAALVAMPVFAAKKKAKKQPEVTMPTLEIIEKVNNAYQYLNKAEQNAFWEWGAYHSANMEAYNLTQNAQWLEYSDKWARHNKFSGATEKDTKKWKYQKYGEGQDFVLFADWQTCFQTYIDMYELTPVEHKLARTKEVMDYMAQMPQNDLWWWVDALYMGMPGLAKMAHLTGEHKYKETMKRLFQFTDSLLWDKDDQLYYRDAKYIYPKHKTDTSKKDFWARGNGWAMAAFARVLQNMPENCGCKKLYVNRLKEMASAVAKCQQPEGYWTRSMLDPEQAVGPETSGTAFMTFALYYGINTGLLDKDEYGSVADKAWNYLKNTAMQQDFSIGYVQPVGEKAIKNQQVSATSTAPFGTAAFLLAACERVRFEDGSRMSNVKFTVEVKNSSNRLRHEVVELSAERVFTKLNIHGGRQFRVINAVGQEVPYQITSDGKVLVEATVRPNGSAKFVVEKGTPQNFAYSCYGRMYPERVDDIAWENDLSAYRCYGPALQANKEQAFGNDVWVKNTKNLDVEHRYYVEDCSKPMIARLKKALAETTDEAKKAEIQQQIKEIDMTMSYHFDQGRGLDCYKVGPSLGTGTPALMVGNDIQFPYCWVDYKILDNGPLRFGVALQYEKKEFNGDSLIECRVVTLDKADYFNRCRVLYDGATKPVDIASGVVIHEEDTKSLIVGSNYVAYADPTDNPTGQNFQIFTGALFPNKTVEMRKVMLDKPDRGIAGHALGIQRNTEPDKVFDYWFGSAWSKNDCLGLDEWQLRCERKLKDLAEPLQVVF